MGVGECRRPGNLQGQLFPPTPQLAHSLGPQTLASTQLWDRRQEGLSLTPTVGVVGVAKRSQCFAEQRDLMRQEGAM